MGVKKLVVLCGLLFCSAGLLAQDKLEIIIDGVDKTLPVAIVPFGWNGEEGKQPIDLHVTIANDLNRSGRFSTMDPADMPQQPDNYAQINFRNWQLLQMENMVIGSLKQTDRDSYEVEFRLLDVYKGGQLAGFQIQATGKQLRRTAHRISDIIFEKLTGVRGAFNTRIAYVTVKKTGPETKTYSLHTADADGFNPQTLLQSTEPLLSPAWSPDGKTLAYVSFEGKNSSIYLQNILTGEREQVAAFPGINSAPAWSPDGTRLAMTLSRDGNPEIYLLYLSTGSLKRLTNNQAIDTEANWSPDGRKLVFTSDRGGSPQIYQMDSNGENQRRLTFDGTYFARPRYAPDGNSIAMVAGQDQRYRIAWMDLVNEYMTLLTTNRLDESPSFSPNGSMIIYSTTGERGSELAAVSADGEVHQRLALQDGEVREPAWGPFSQ
ncbi:MAG: Tol-Pal system beta propeller repeat protein TolB [Gammaproteobacteria bacterium]